MPSIPSTCAEAAQRLRDEAEFSNDSRFLKEIAFTLESFGSAPVPQAILKRWNWTDGLHWQLTLDRAEVLRVRDSAMLLKYLAHPSQEAENQWRIQCLCEELMRLDSKMSRFIDPESSLNDFSRTP